METNARIRFSRYTVALALAVASLAGAGRAALQDGALKIEVISAYNLVVDSNIESPAGRCPTAAHLGLRVYNNGATPMTGVTLRIGDLLNSATFSGTAGTYPVTTITAGSRPYSGSFSFTHQGGTADATRYIPSIPAGGSVTVYWLVSYPVKDAAGKTLAGAANVVADDLQLDYDMWVEGYENGTTLRRAYSERHMTCRNEISAMANKIWPNTTAKVPDQYLDVFNEQLGWRPNASIPRMPEADIVEGIWYDFGTIRHGFDNNGDLLPDYNAWMQPVGDPVEYDASCFRLVKCYGVVIVKLNDGTEKLIPFEDELYFQNLPENNVGAVGLVYYEFVALKQGCTGRLSPYQEVASGYDNEKFNADYGATLGSWESKEIKVSLDKNAPAITNAGATITYDMTARNTGTVALGDPSVSLPLVITDFVPTGLVYVASSATANNTLPAGVGVGVRYSTNGTSWVTSEPVPASSVVGLQWWLEAPLATNAQVTVRFQATIPSGYPGVFVKNCSGVGLGNNAPIAQDCATTLIQGVNSVSGVVFEDDGSGVNFANRIKDAGDAGETGIVAVAVSLYLDQNTNGVVDSADLLVATRNSAASTGAYSFTTLPDGRYIVVVDPLDPDVTANYALTTVPLRAVDLDSAHATGSAVSVTDQNFGFAPPLSLDKSGGSTVYEGQEVTYSLDLKNYLYSTGSGGFTNLYWVPSNSVQRVNLSLSNLVTVSSNTGVSNPNWGIYVDRTRDRLYWADQVADKIWQDDMNALTPAAATTFISGVVDPGYVAVDHKAPGGKSYLWWSASGKLQRTDLGLSTPVIEDRYTIISDVSCGIAIDEANRWIYFVSKPSGNGKYTLYRQNMDAAAGTIDTTWSVERTVNPFYDLVIDPVGQKLYFVDRGVGVKLITIDIATMTSATTFNVDNGSDVRGLAVDVPADRIYFSDSVANQIDEHVLSTGAQAAILSVNTNPGDIDIEYGAGLGTFDVNATIGELKLTDTYPPNLLSFVRASIPPDSTTPAGTLTWNNLGPLNGGDSLSIAVTFRALAQVGNSVASLINTATVTRAVMVNGDPTNTPQDTTPTQILPAGSIAGTVWADTDADGWQPLTGFPSYGYETGEKGIGGVLVRLEVDSNNDGTVDWAVTNRTDAFGNYLFPSLATNVRYRVAIDFASLPGTSITATGDPDDDGVNAGNGATGSANNLWSNAAAGWFSLGVNSWKNAAGTAQSWDITNVNFGYAGTDPVLYGLVWLDLNRDGVRDAGEPGLSGASVALTGASSVTLLTGADGTYTFRTNSAGAALNTGSYTITVTPPSGPTWTYTFENYTNAFGVVNGNTATNGVQTFTVAGASETSGSWDFGLIYAGTRKIGDTVFFDLNADGTQGTGEVGIAGVDVNLFLDTNGNGVLDANDFLWTTQTTDASGKYLFTNLVSSTYFVVVDESDIPTSFRQTADPDQSGVVATAGDGMGVVTLGASDILTIDFGYAPQGGGRIGDAVFLDDNLNGRQDAGEGGISNVTVRLYYDRDGNGTYETLLATTQTGIGGTYLFEHLLDGAYQVVVDSADTDIPATRTPSTTEDHTVTLTGGVTSLFDGFTTATDRSLDADFGFAPRPYIGDFVFFDANRNGTPDQGEVGIPNVTLRLYTDPNNDGNTADGVLVATTNTATGAGAFAAGYYQFPNLVPGVTYVVKVDPATLPTWNGSPIVQTADPDRDGVPVWDNSIPGLPPGDHADTGIELGLSSYVGADFGYLPSGVIGDTVWRDLNGNGVQESGEPGVAGVKVTAIKGATTMTTYTDGDGLYSFANLADGTWTVAVASTNFVSGGPLDSWVDTYDADGGLNHSTSVVINNGTVSSTYNAWTAKSDASLDVDFGFKLNGPYALSGTVCNNDSGASGIYDDPVNETELAGLTVRLYTSGGLLLGSTTTDVGGYYSFTNLPSGSYRVVLGTTVPPLDTARLTTVAANTGATLLTNTGTSVIQDITIAGASRTGIDFAFVPTVFFDYGDLPVVYDITTLAQDGARHAIPTNGVSTIYLGTVPPDADPDGMPSALANADDTLDGNDDEDGIVPVNTGAWADGANGGSVQVTVRAPSGQSVYLVGWIDFDQDGTLSGAGEQIISTAVTGTGSAQAATYTFDIPAGTMAALDKAWFARFRVFAEPPPFPAFSYTGAATDGEVEDTLFRVGGVSLGDHVWTDTNGNGVQDGGEPGMTNVTVRLYNASSNEVAVTTTDAAGNYRFDNLAAGAYQVGFVAPSGYLFTVRDSAAANDATDSDAYAVTGLTAPVTLTAGTTNLTVDAGLALPVAISGFVRIDLNGNGTVETGDTNGIAGVTVQLLDAAGSNVVTTTTTAANGSYSFTNLLPGTYTVREIDLAGWYSTTDIYLLNDNRIVVELTSGQTSAGNNFHDAQTAAFGDFVWVDLNGDGVQGASEPGIPNVRVYVDSDGSGTYSVGEPSATTSVTGAYQIGDLAAGTYTARVDVATLPLNLVQTYDLNGPLDGAAIVTLTTAQTRTDVDFGYRGTGSVGDRVFADFNNNGIWDAGEGIAGVDVTVTGDFDGDGSPETVTVTTGTDGLWLVAGLRTTTGGVSYTVTVDTADLPAGLTINSVDPDGGSNSTSVVSLTSSAPDRLDQDFGYRSPAVYLISGQVRDDFDIDGEFPDPDMPVGGITVRLFTDPNGDGDPADGVVLQSALTRPDGTYVFSNVIASAYVVVETDPTYSVSTADVAGPNDNRVPVVVVNANSVGNDFLDAIDPSGYLYDVADGRIVPGGSISIAQPGATILMDGSSGQYMFISTNAVETTYTIAVTPPPGYVIDPSRPAQPGSFDATGGPDPTVLGSYESLTTPGYLVHYSAASNTYYYTFTLAPGDPPVINNNFPLVRLASVGNFVWHDVDADGFQDAGETGIVGVAVSLLRITNGGATTNVAATTQTAAGGAYLFDNLDPGTYRVRVDAPAAYAFSPLNAVADRAVDSDFGLNHPFTASFTLAYGDARTDLDAGLYYEPTLAVLTSFRAFVRDGQTVVAWEVAAEFDTLGYWIERRVGDAWVRINPDEPVWSDLLPWGPFTYQLADPGAAPGGTYDWRVVELEGSGAENVYGPYAVTVDGAAADFDAWAANIAWSGAASGRDDDPDGDGLTNFEEFLAGTNPLDRNSTLKITALRPVEGGLEVRWPSVAGHVYAVEFARSFGDAWLPVAAAEAATPPENRFVLPLRPDQPTGLLRVVLKAATP